MAEYTLTRDNITSWLREGSWIEEVGNREYFCRHDRLLGKVTRTPLGIPLCDGCDEPVEECTCLTEAVSNPLRRAA